MPILKMGQGWDSAASGNHESAQSETEVKRLVRDGIALLSNLGGSSALGQKFASLRNAGQYQTITITKGIHQRGDDPHITVQTADALLFHINLTARPAPSDAEGYAVAPGEERFVWKASQVSVVIDKQTYFYPSTTTGNGAGRARGLSFTQGQLSSLIASAQAASAQRQAEALAEQAAIQQQIAAGKAASAKAFASHKTNLAAGKNPWGGGS